MLWQPVVQMHLVSSKRALGAAGWVFHSLTLNPFSIFQPCLPGLGRGSLEKKSLHIHMSGNLPLSHDTLVQSVTREAVTLSQTIGNRSGLRRSSITLHTVEYPYMTQTNFSIPLHITLFNAEINFRPSCLSAEQYFAAVLLSVSESSSPLTLPFPQRAIVIMSHPVTACQSMEA